VNTSLLIKNGVVVNADKKRRADVYIDEGRIKEIKKSITRPAGRTIDASGCFLFPGGIDPHVHMELPVRGGHSSDTFSTGSRAALFGGTTTIIDFANQERGGTLSHALGEWMSRANGNSFCDFAFHVSITDYNDRTRREIRECVERHGVSSFKIFTAYEALRIGDADILAIMEDVAKLHAIVLAHAENGDMIERVTAKHRSHGKHEVKYHPEAHPVEAEIEATTRLVDMALHTGCALYVVHITSGEALRRLAGARKAHARRKRLPSVFAETCPQYLLLDRALYEVPGFEGAKYVCSPPLRGAADRAALWRGIEDGRIDTLATDHCPFTMKQKEWGLGDYARIPNGVPGVEHRMQLLFSEGVAKKRIKPERFVELTSTAAARVFGLYPKKGAIMPGSDGDIVIFDPEAVDRISARSHHMNCDYSVYEDLRVRGRCRTVILRGTVAVDGGALELPEGFGRYIPRVILV